MKKGDSFIICIAYKDLHNSLCNYSWSIPSCCLLHLDQSQHFFCQFFQSIYSEVHWSTTKDLTYSCNGRLNTKISQALKAVWCNVSTVVTTAVKAESALSSFTSTSAALLGKHGLNLRSKIRLIGVETTPITHFVIPLCFVFSLKSYQVTRNALDL